MSKDFVLINSLCFLIQCLNIVFSYGLFIDLYVVSYEKVCFR